MSDSRPNIVSDKSSVPESESSKKQNTGEVDEQVHLQQDDVSIDQINDDANGNSADVVSLDTFRKKPT